MKYDIIIIGGGVAGLTASIYSASRGLKTLVLDKNCTGGVIGKVSTVTHFPGVYKGESGPEYFNRLMEQVKLYDIDIKLETVTKLSLNGRLKTVTTNNETYTSDVVILANGTTPNEINAKNIEKFLNNGISHCALKDIPKYKNKEVFIVGGSDGAIKEALYISKFAKKVHVIHFEDSITAVEEFKKPLLNSPNVSIHLHSVITEVDGETTLDTVIIKDIHTENLTKFNIPDTCIFVYIGAYPNSNLFKNEITLKDNFVVTNDKMETNIEGVYAAGDIRYKLVKQVATAANDGAIAAINAFNFINNIK